MISITAISSIAILYLKNIAIVLIIIYLWCITIKENNKYSRKMHLYNLINDLDTNKEMYEDDVKI